MTNTASEADVEKDKEAPQEAREYEAEQARRENEILDARMEYGHLMSTYMSLVNMFWLGYGAFFTINSLFATALGISYSQNAQSMDPWFLLLLHLLIPMAGIFISGCAIYAAILIVRNQRLTEQRGCELETAVLRSQIFQRMRGRSSKYPNWTIVGALFFAALWLSTLFAISPWPSFGCGETSKNGLQIHAFCKPA
jgi:hypothetical protein